MKMQLPAVFSCIRSALRRRGTAQETDESIQEVWSAAEQPRA